MVAEPSPPRPRTTTSTTDYHVTTAGPPRLPPPPPPPHPPPHPPQPLSEADQVEILSGVVDGVAIGTPIAMLVRNKDQRSQDYGENSLKYRPSHADATYDAKYVEPPPAHHTPPTAH